jgi:hypothetical protein
VVSFLQTVSPNSCAYLSSLFGVLHTTTNLILLDFIILIPYGEKHKESYHGVLEVPNLYYSMRRTSAGGCSNADTVCSCSVGGGSSVDTVCPCSAG